MNVLLLSRYGSHGASSRVRFLQYREWLYGHGVRLKVSVLFPDQCIGSIYKERRAFSALIFGYTRRISSLANVHRYALAIMEKELFPFLPAAAKLLLEW
jgi:hypothetical protein